MDTSDMKTFVALAETRSVSRAAGELHLTQPAVTRRLQRFETAIGAQLIDRRHRPFGLTEVGEAALEHCRRLLASAEQLRSLTHGARGPTRDIRIGVAHALTELALCEPVEALHREHPGVALRLHTGWSRDLLARVRSGALDAAVILLPRDEALPEELNGQVVGKEEFAVVARRKLRAAPRTIGDFSNATWILNPEGCGARVALERRFARERVPLRVGIETYNYELQLSLIAAGRGFGLVPRRLLARSPVLPLLRTLRVTGLEFPMVIWMLSDQLAPALSLPVAALGRALGSRLAQPERPGDGRERRRERRPAARRV